jgi:DNA-binding PadR family transcriptional regulator
MSLEHILLGMLKTPATGYELKAEFDQGARHFWSAELAQIYPTLQRMERKGWLKSQMQASDKGPARRVYHRTPKGNAELRHWATGEPIMGVERFAYLGQLIHQGELHDLSRTLQFVQQLRAKQASLLSILESALRGMSEQDPLSASSMSDEEFCEWLCLELGRRAISARVGWCDEMADIVRRRAAQNQGSPTHKPGGRGSGDE